MSAMTVHSDRTRSPSMTVHSDRTRGSPRTGQGQGRGPHIVNGGHNVEGPLLDNLTLSQSWNGCTWQIHQTPDNGGRNHLENCGSVGSPGNSIMGNSNGGSGSGSVGSGTSGSGYQNGLLHTFPMSAKIRDMHLYQRRDSLLSKSRDSPVSIGSGDRLSIGDRLSNSSDRNKFTVSYDDDSLTTASSNFDSSEQDEEYVTLDRSYVFSRPFKINNLTHHSSMIDLKHNSLYSPKVNNDEVSSIGSRSSSTRTLPHNRKFRGALRSFSQTDPARVHETNLDAVDENGRTVPWAKRSLKRIYENLGEVIKSSKPSSKSGSQSSLPVYSDYVGIPVVDNGSLKNESCNQSNSGKKPTMNGKLRKRSKSLGELQLFNENNENELDLSSSGESDADGDDFGFLSYNFVHSSTVMHKSKSPSPHHRILPKRWRSKPRNSTAGTCLWSPEGNCTWCNVSGRRLVLRSTSILQLSEAERLTLQKIVLAKLQAADLGCSVVIPKEHKEPSRRKKHLLSMKRSKSANLSGLIHGLSDREKEKDAPSSLVFGIPLSKCISNDLELQKKRNAGPLQERKSSDVIIHRQGPRKSSSSSQGSVENYAQNGTSFSDSQKRNASCQSLTESENSRNTNSSLIDALTLTSNRNDSVTVDNVPYYAIGSPQVPQIVKACFQHIETYGLRVLGIFRVGSSKKRTKQLREEFDSGKDVKLNDSHNPHEIGAVLKEYFRDLPEPLLTRDLYSPFIASRVIANEERRHEIMRLLIALLPVPNRDTLWSLLQFLSEVQEHSTDLVDENGQMIPGNKMDSTNLATLFGPNILHKAKVTEKEFSVESLERAEERKDVIDVVRTMIDQYRSLFQIPAELHDEILQQLLESDPETTEMIIRRLTNDNGIEADPDTSSSAYDESDTSLPHSPVSEADLQFKQTPSNTLSPLRTARSADVLTPSARRRFFFATDDRKDSDFQKRKSESLSGSERPKFHLVIENSPSPPEVSKTPRASRAHTQRPKISRENSNPEICSMRPHSIHGERPHSELYTTPRTLSIPAPNYMRHNNEPEMRTSRSSPVPHRSPSFQRTGNQSPTVTSSIQRPLNFNRATPEGENEWQKDRWRNWDSISSENPKGGYEQETLV